MGNQDKPEKADKAARTLLTMIRWPRDPGQIMNEVRKRV